MKYSLIPIILFICILPLHAETRELSLDECIALAMKQNIELQAAEKSVERARALQGTAWDMEKTELGLVQSPSEGGGPENALTISQQMEFPTYYVARRRQLKAETRVEESRLALLRATVAADVASAYYQLSYEQQRQQLLAQQDSILLRYVTLARKRLEAGEIRRLELLTAERLYKENSMKAAAAKTEEQAAESKLLLLLGGEPEEGSRLEVEGSRLKVGGLRLKVGGLRSQLENLTSQVQPINNPDGKSPFKGDLEGPQGPQGPQGPWGTVSGLYASRLAAADYAIKTAKNAYAPSLSLTLKNQLVITGWNPYNVDRSRVAGGNFMGFEFGIGLPIFYASTKAKVKAAKREREMLTLEIKQQEQQRTQEYATALNRLQQAEQKLEYYQKDGEASAAEILRLANIEYEAGEISYIEYINALQESLTLRMSAAEATNEYLQSICQLKKINP